MPGMDVAREAFYTSGTFWAGASVVVAVLAAVAVVRATLAAAFPRRRLHYGLRTVAPLPIASILTAPEGVRPNLELLHHGTPLADPYVLAIELTSSGRKDIPTDAYDAQTPLVFDVGSRIIEILRIVSEPKIRRQPKVTADVTLLKIGPSLLDRHHKITINVLTDGGHPSLSCTENPLVDVQVRERLIDRPDRTQTWALVVCGIAAVALAGIAEEFALRKSAGWAAVAAASAAILAIPPFLATRNWWPSRWRTR